jgi:TRAP-type C4-dicarboxylate transport system substrate-binding protein
MVTANMAQSYVDIKNGVYEGYTIGEAQAFPYRTFEVAPYLTRTWFGVTNTPAIVVNQKTWESLPDFVRKIIQDVSDGWFEQYNKLDDQRLTEWTETMIKRGVKVHEMPVEERKRWAAMMPNIAKEWAADLDKQGLPGSKVLTAYMDGVRASGQPVIRNWDKE